MMNRIISWSQIKNKIRSAKAKAPESKPTMEEKPIMETKPKPKAKAKKGGCKC